MFRGLTFIDILENLDVLEGLYSIEELGFLDFSSYSFSGALSRRSINWSSFGVMMIWVRRLRCLPTSVSLLATGLYSPRPPAVRRLGATPNLFCRYW